MSMVDTQLNKTMKETTLNGHEIKGICTAIPNKKVRQEDFFQDFSEKEIKSISKMTGVQERYWVEKESTSDLCVHAGRELLKEINWEPNSVDALIFITQSPDYVLPATAIRIQGDLGISKSIVAFDINLGCSGYPYGLFMADTLINSGVAERVLVCVGETTSKIIDKKDKTTALLFGDAGSVTAVERSKNDRTTKYVFGTDPSGQQSLIVPESRFRGIAPELLDKIDGKDPHYIYMDGAEVFNFTLREVEPLVSSFDAEHIDFYLFHQANLFMLNYLVGRIGLNSDSVPINIDLYGNTSSASIPLLICSEKEEIFKEKDEVDLGMFGFGVGFSWSGCVKNLGKDVPCILTKVEK